MTEDDIAFHLTWRPASGHPGGWRVCRQDYRPGADPRLQELTRKDGRVRLFRTFDGAKRRADAMNRDG